MRGKWFIVVLSAVGALAALAVARRRSAAAATEAQPATSSPAVEDPAQSELLPVKRGTNGRFTKRQPAPAGEDAGASSAELAAAPSAN